jgi:hypothetical protein
VIGEHKEGVRRAIPTCAKPLRTHPKLSTTHDHTRSHTQLRYKAERTSPGQVVPPVRHTPPLHTVGLAQGPGLPRALPLHTWLHTTCSHGCTPHVHMVAHHMFTRFKTLFFHKTDGLVPRHTATAATSTARATSTSTLQQQQQQQQQEQ